MSSPISRLNEERFGRTAEAFAARAAGEMSAQLESLLDLLALSPADLMLDVACGPGRLLATAAAHVRLGAGVDLTAPMLAIARREHRARGVGALVLVRGDAERLPFRDEAFTVVTTTLAIHHLGNPRRVLEEMVCACRAGGRVAVGDFVGSEDPEKRARQNQIERFRDPSHVEAYSASGLEALLGSCGLTITGRSAGTFVRQFDEWCRISGAPPEVAARLRVMLLETQPGDQAGMDPQFSGDALTFRHRWVNLVARKPG